MTNKPTGRKRGTSPRGSSPKDGRKRGYTPRGWPVSKRLEFWSEPGAGGCRLWVGATNQDGYGIIFIDGARVSAHRAAWVDAKGPVPAGLCVCHKCDVPACIEVDHLFLGTQIENIADRDLKARTAKGEARSQSKLTDEAVREVRAALPKNGRAPYGALARLARKFGVDKSSIDDARYGRTWGHVQ